jgi:hypothetical protein
MGYGLENFVGQSHWQYIWVPTAEDMQSPKYLFDTLLTLSATQFFFPFGYLLSQHLARPR